MRPAPLPLLLGSLLLVAGVATAFVAASRPPAPPALCVRGGPPPVRVFRSDCRGKPLPALGEIVATVTERPAPDRAIVRIDWTRGPVGEACRLQVAAPDGAGIVAGESDVLLPAGLEAGASTVTIGFPPDRTLDLVVRLYALVDGAPLTRETCVRL